ncbi:hypothetical protein DCCM_0920 [Desulfocucumis palustris]|uniref:Cell division protein ZapA n=1 Tax=Desulfocucumis palustris TaxID=1898651 RepID=A0A2L2X9V2_9FIRM|nr:cell division protein ZapA [Desulfocucumis palustris]GBF32724.1 hypothetical protein DCCM_0920 [Desulfocucumis palustris]
MPGEVNRVVVDIFGVQYNLKGEEPVEHLEELASMVDRKMREINSRNPRLNMSQAAVLAALNIADDYLKLKESVNLGKEPHRESGGE